MRGNSASCYVETPRLGGVGVKNAAKNLMAINSTAGHFQNFPTKSCLN